LGFNSEPGLLQTVGSFRFIGLKFLKNYPKSMKKN